MTLSLQIEDEDDGVDAVALNKKLEDDADFWVILFD